jgi:ABC-type sugar transport system ATPase subunit
MTALEMRNIIKSYDGKTVLDVEYFSMESGELVALVGQNGSGKTTLLSIAALLTKQDSGDVKILGKDLSKKNTSELRSQVTFVAQEPYFFNGSLHSNMMFGLSNSAGDKGNSTRLIAETLELLGLNHLASRYPRSFSSGEMKRAAIARALVLDTPILLLDEPFANIDVQSSELLEKVIDNKGKKAIIYTTHDINRAHALSDRVITLLGGALSPWTPENMFRMSARLAEDGTELTSESGIQIYYPHELQPDKIYSVSIDPSQIILSIKPVETSAQNSYLGKITKIESIGQNLIAFNINCGSGFSIRAIVTQRTLDSFKSTVGDEIWIHFKSAAIHVFR